MPAESTPCESASLAGLSNDVFFQVGLLTTVGLASKNAILIIEFARSLEREGKEFRRVIDREYGKSDFHSVRQLETTFVSGSST